MSAPEDSRIVGDVLDGDVNAYALLVKKYQKPVYNLMYRTTGSRELSMDMAQETMVRAYENLERFNRTRRFFPWLYAIGVNLARDHLRRAGREARIFESGLEENSAHDCSANQGKLLEQKLEMSQVLNAMEALSLDQREALILRYREELSMKEIGLALGISVSGAKMRVHRAIKELQRILRKDPR